jgi:pimeloyl-ACP methyl ester carboxylesterase
MSPRFTDLPGRIASYEVSSEFEAPTVAPPLVVFPGLSRYSSSPSDDGLDRAARTYGPLARVTSRSVVLIERPRGMPPTITMPELAARHAPAIRSRFSEPIDLMGISTGGAIALQLAVDHPMLIRRLIIACSACWLGDRGRRKLRRYGDLVAEGRSGAAVLASVLGGPIMRWPLTPLLWLGSRSERNIDPSDMLATIHAECGYDVTPRLVDIKPKTLIIGGRNDHAFPPELLRQTADGIPGSCLILYPRRGHISAMLDPRFGRDIAAFLSSP